MLNSFRRKSRSKIHPQNVTFLPKLESLEDRFVLNGSYFRTDLTSDIPGLARTTDPNLVNPWGLAFNPTGAFWVSDEGTGVSTLYTGGGRPFPPNDPLIVEIPPPPGDEEPAEPTGLVFSGSNDFVVSDGGVVGPSRFIFATEGGTIAGWAPNVNLTHAFTAVDNSSSDAIYKGLALGSNVAGNFLYAADFHNAKIDVFDKDFQAVHLAGNFTDQNLPDGYAPFNIQNLNGWLYVTYAKQDADGEDDVPGKGFGFVDIYNTDGKLIERLISRGKLNAPWGLALAPSGFGPASGALLVGNFGDGHINAYNPLTGEFLGKLRDADHHPIEIEGLWGLSFGNGVDAGDPHTLFFNAGIEDETHGLFGSIEFMAGGRSSDGDDKLQIDLSGCVDHGRSTGMAKQPKPISQSKEHLPPLDFVASDKPGATNKPGVFSKHSGSKLQPTVSSFMDSHLALEDLL